MPTAGGSGLPQVPDSTGGVLPSFRPAVTQQGGVNQGQFGKLAQHYYDVAGNVSGTASTGGEFVSIPGLGRGKVVYVVETEQPGPRNSTMPNISSNGHAHHSSVASVSLTHAQDTTSAGCVGLWQGSV